MIRFFHGKEEPSKMCLVSTSSLKAQLIEGPYQVRGGLGSNPLKPEFFSSGFLISEIV